MSAYRIESGAKADVQLADLDAAIGASVERKILWLGQNAAGMVHRRLVGMPDELSGLCKLRVGDYRILYWIYQDKKSWCEFIATSTARKSIATCKASAYSQK